MAKKNLFRKFNNKGMSLVEILVTVAIIALIASPLINSFLNAMKVNTNARLIQNGTAVAQDTAELFKVFDVESLIASYEDEEGVAVYYDEDTGVYVFSGIEAEGADGEEFEVSVKLDPTAYSADAESDKIDVNDVNLPVFSGLYGSDTIVLYRQYAGSDEQLPQLFAGSEVGATELAAINSGDYSKLKKSTQVDVICSYNEAMDTYDYEVKLKMTYTHNNMSSVSVTKNMEKTYSGDEIHTIYMICPIFDRYSHSEMGSDYFYNTDEIKINYTFNGEPEDEKEIYFYLAEQEMSNIGYDSTKQERINPRNLYVDGTVYTEYNNETGSIKVYTNIGDKDATFHNDYSLTYGDYNTGVALYEMNVEVTLKGEEGVIARFTTTK